MDDPHRLLLLRTCQFTTAFLPVWIKPSYSKTIKTFLEATEELTNLHYHYVLFCINPSVVLSNLVEPFSELMLWFIKHILYTSFCYSNFS